MYNYLLLSDLDNNPFVNNGCTIDGAIKSREFMADLYDSRWALAGEWSSLTSDLIYVQKLLHLDTTPCAVRTKHYHNGTVVVEYRLWSVSWGTTVFSGSFTPSMCKPAVEPACYVEI